jgi:hypothetical protein
LTDDLLKQPPPENSIERIQTLARDLAYGAIQGLWTPKILVLIGPPVEPITWLTSEGSNDQHLLAYLSDKWNDQQPAADLLVSFGYFNWLGQRESGTNVYILTEKAFGLLEKPTSPPSVFISYRRNQSSALGLLIVARLKAVGIENPFIDMNIDPGDEWHALLETTVRQSQYVIALIAPGTIESPYVRRELDWALAAPGVHLIPIWHNGYAGDGDYPEALSSKNAIRIKEESAEEYELAMIKLLNRLGYMP